MRPADASFRKVNVGNVKLVCVCKRKDGKKIFVILNLSGSEQAVKVYDRFIGQTL
jgi:hypothetical protein